MPDTIPISPISYVKELIEDAKKEANMDDEQSEATTPPPLDNPALKIATFLDKVARELREENPEVFDKQLQELFVGEDVDGNTLKLRESVKQRILQLNQGMAPPS